MSICAKIRLRLETWLGECLARWLGPFQETFLDESRRVHEEIWALDNRLDPLEWKIAAMGNQIADLGTRVHEQLSKTSHEMAEVRQGLEDLSNRSTRLAEHLIGERATQKLLEHRREPKTFTVAMRQ